MSKAVKVATQASETGAEVPFEEALKKLEAIVDSMESDDLPLESLIQQFEEGTRLVQVCQCKLAEAEVKIQKLELDQSGKPALNAFTAVESNPEN